MPFNVEAQRPLERSVRGLQVSNSATWNFAVDDLPAKVMAMGNSVITGFERVSSAEVFFEDFTTLVMGDVNVE